MSAAGGSSGRGSESGFTLVELLVVVIITGILAAIAIPTFLSQREAAQDATAKSTVRNAQTAILSYRQIAGDYPPGTNPAMLQLKKLEPTINWRESVGTRDRPTTGQVPFEVLGTAIVFGTRSESGRCFYMRIDSQGKPAYGSDTDCDDPYETSNDGKVESAGW